jgi:5-methylcytosine-specific restriction endonuclease McrA
MIRSSKKARQRRSLVIKLDALARERCFERDNHMCVRCHNSRKVQWAHVISRRHLITRWELDNALSLCYTCHAFWHSYPSLSGPWFAKGWPHRHERITALFNEGGKVDLEALLEEMTTPPSVTQYMSVPKDSDLPF